MSRQSAFPGIFVESIEVEKPPFDEPGVIQEFVGQGVMRDFEVLQRASSFSEETVGEFLQSAEDQIGPLRDSFKLKYNLKIRAAAGRFADVSSVITKIQMRTVRGRARLFVRVKNPFEPDILEVKEPELDEQLSSEELGNAYDVTVTVTK